MSENAVSEEIQLPGLPDVKIVDQNGKRLDTSAIDNYDAFMTFLMTASIAANTGKLRRYHEDRTSKGKTQNFPLTITPTFQEVRCPYPAQSLYLVNDGPGQIFVNINALVGDPTPLLINEALSVDFETHELERFWVWSAAGTVATARAVAAF